jgi:hypothetical protein
MVTSDAPLATATPPLYCSCFLGGARECLQRLQKSAPVASKMLFSIMCLRHDYVESRLWSWAVTRLHRLHVTNSLSLGSSTYRRATSRPSTSFSATCTQ